MKHLFIGYCHIFLSVVLAFFLSFPAYSQSAQIGETIEERQHSRSQDQIKSFEQKLQRAPSGTILPKLEVQGEGIKAGNCVQVGKIEVNGQHKYAQGEFDSLKSNAHGQCLYISDINEILRSITNRYIRDGYVTSRATLPKQDLEDGSLEITVVEGRVEGIKAGDDIFTARELAFAFPIRTNQRLNLRDIEQGVDQLSRLPSRSPTIDIKAGKTLGGSLIVVDDKGRGRPYGASIRVDNSGQSSTGKTIVSSSLSAENIFGVNDLWSLSANTDLDGGADGGVWGLNGFVSIPYGYFSTSFSGGFFAYDSLIPGVVTDIENDGTSWFATGSLDWLIYRDATRKLSLTSGFGITDNDNFVSDIRLLASSFRLATFNLGVDYQERLFGGVLSARADWVKGTELFGADSIFTGDEGPQRIFNKLEYDLGFALPIQFKTANFFYSSNLRGQFSDKNLFSAERISIGSPSSVRGFRSGGISGDEGFVLRQDVQWSNVCCEINSGWLEGEVSISPFIGIDVGQIKTDISNDFERGVLKSVTAGGRAQVKNLLFSVSISHGIESPSFVSSDDFEVNTSISLNF